MVNWVEASIRPVDGVVKRQDMHAAEQAGQRPVEQVSQFGQSPAAQPVRIGDELDLVFHGVPGLEPLGDFEGVQERIHKAHPFKILSILEVFAQNDWNLVEVRGRPDLSIVVGKLMIAHAAHRF